MQKNTQSPILKQFVSEKCSYRCAYDCAQLCYTEQFW